MVVGAIHASDKRIIKVVRLFLHIFYTKLPD